MLPCSLHRLAEPAPGELLVREAGGVIPKPEGKDGEEKEQLCRVRGVPTHESGTRNIWLKVRFQDYVLQQKC